MAFKVNSVMLLAIILAAATINTAEATVTKTTTFGNYNNIVSKLTSMSERLTVLRAVWGEIRADEPLNLEHTKTFYDNLLENTKTALNAEAEEAAELAAEVRQILVIINGQLLAETLNHNNSQKIVNVQVFRTQLLQKYNVELSSAIFEHAIDAAYPFKRTDFLHAELNAIDINPTNGNVYKLRVNWNLYLYHKFLQRGDINDKYVYEAALALRNLKYSTFYNTLPSDSLRRIDAAFETFPSSLSTLFNSTAVCLENANLHNYFLYFAESTASSASSYVPAVVRNRFDVKSNDRLVWSNSFADRNNMAATTAYFRLKSNLWYLYRQGNNQAALIQRTDGNQLMRNWVPSLVDNKIVFEQLGNFLCATPQFASDLLGFAVNSTFGEKSQDTNCQWILTDCSKM